MASIIRQGGGDEETIGAMININNNLILSFIKLLLCGWRWISHDHGKNKSNPGCQNSFQTRAIKEMLLLS